MKILLSFIGNNDCYPYERPGTLVTALSERDFDHVCLLYNDDRYLAPAQDITLYCKDQFPDLAISLHNAPAIDPIDYNLVYPSMYAAVRNITGRFGNADYTVSLTSGTPTMHACWIFLVKGGVIDARLIQISREAGISDVSLELEDFPNIERVDAVKAEMTRLSRENRRLKKRLELDHDAIIGVSPEIQKVKDQIGVFAGADVPVFIHGETGTGKELAAEAIHHNGPRKDRPFIPVNCGAISEHLFESEFFGHKKGAFTGAIKDKEGVFNQADGGTVFLDEVAELPPEMQVKLLRVLGNGMFTPVGAVKAEQADVRIISATNRDIGALVRDGGFREDLFYRLVVARISMPPLARRREDRLLLANHFLEGLNRKYGGRKVLGKAAADLIQSYHWPGNVRQLKNALEAAYVYPGDAIEAENFHIFEISSGQSSEIEIPDGGVDLNNDILPRYYRAALEKSGGNAAEAARLLGLKAHTFRARLKTVEGKNIDHIGK